MSFVLPSIDVSDENLDVILMSSCASAAQLMIHKSDYRQFHVDIGRHPTAVAVAFYDKPDESAAFELNLKTSQFYERPVR